MEIRKAQRKKAKLRLGLSGASGAGKTMSALKMARGLGGSVCLIDTERGSGDLYSDLYDYSIIQLVPPFKPSAYVDAIKAAEAAGFDIIIIDSLSHAWADEGGLLDQADKMAAKGGNRFTAWADLTPQHRSLVNAMLNSSKHIIATVRSKQAYEMEEYTDQKGNKKSKPVKIGMAPIQREGMEYEFTVFMDISIDHFARASKDRTNSFKDEIFMIDEKVGERLMAWLNAGLTVCERCDRKLGKTTEVTEEQATASKAELGLVLCPACLEAGRAAKSVPPTSPSAPATAPEAPGQGNPQTPASEANQGTTAPPTESQTTPAPVPPATMSRIEVMNEYKGLLAGCTKLEEVDSLKGMASMDKRLLESDFLGKAIEGLFNTRIDELAASLPVGQNQIV